MAERLIELGSWRIFCDPEANREVYSRIATGGPEQCSCDNCKWFVSAREKFYPDELKNLLASMGIDYRKEVEVVTYGERGRSPLGGWYNFVGRIEQGEADLQPLPGGFQLEIATGGLLVQPEFGSLPVAKLEWQWLSN